MYTHPDSQLCFQDSVHKDWIIHVVEDNFDITNELIYKDEINTADSLCSNEDITLGSCESVEFDFKMKNTGTTLLEKHLEVSLVLNNHTSTPIPIGRFKVDEDELEDDQRVRSIKAHDALYEINTKDFAPWFNNLSFPMTLKEFRDSFFQYAGVTQETVSLPNDNIVKFNFVVTNSSATKRMIEEEQEKRNQLVEAARLGLTTVKYTLIDPNTYDDYPCIDNSTYLCDNTHGYKPSYTRVQNPPTGSIPVQLGWFERNADGIYFRSQDNKLVPQHIYYSVDTPPSVNPQDSHWWEYQLGASTSGYFETRDTTIKADSRFGYKTYYEKNEDILRSPRLLCWWKIQGTGQDAKYVPCDEDEIVLGRDYYERTEIDPPKPRYVQYYFDTSTPGVHFNPQLMGLFEYDSSTGEYSKTTDTQVDEHKIYYQEQKVENDNTAYVELNLDAHRVDNPKEEGWYEKKTQGDGIVFFETEDTTIDRTKKYYFNIYDELLTIDKDIVEDQILGSEIIQAICEINGCFGHISRTGQFRYIFLKPIDYDSVGLYPASDLYPDPELYPAGAPADAEILRAYYEDITRSDYMVAELDRLVICKEDGDAGYIYPENSLPDNHNTYKITGNFIWYGFTESKEILDVVGMNIFNYGIGQISSYTPCSIDMMGNPCIDVGDTLIIHTRTGDIYTYVMTRTLTGSQRLKDTIEAKGNKKRDTGENNLYDAVIELKGKSNILTRTVDETRSELVSASEGLTSLILQTADSIMLSVSKEIKNTEDSTKTIYEAATKYTDYMIKDTVSKKEYDENNEVISQNFSEFERTADHITAEVASKMGKNGEETGFKWELTDVGMTWSSKGGYKDVTLDLYEQIEQGGHPNPKLLGLYELDTEAQQMVPTKNTEVEEFKSYFEKINSSSTYEPVFTINGSGAWLRGVITVEDLDVRSVATVSLLDAEKIRVDDLLVGYAKMTDLEAAEGRINHLVSDTIQTLKISATQINGGRVDADVITTETLSSRIVAAVESIASSTSPHKGRVVVGNVGAGDYYMWSGPDGTGKYYKIKYLWMEGPDGMRRRFMYLSDEGTSRVPN